MFPAKHIIQDLSAPEKYLNPFEDRHELSMIRYCVAVCLKRLRCAKTVHKGIIFSIKYLIRSQEKHISNPGGLNWKYFWGISIKY